MAPIPPNDSDVPRRMPFDDAFWPVALAIAILAASAGALIVVYGNFVDVPWYRNAWFWLAVLTGLTVGLLVTAERSQHRVGRRMQTALTLSLLTHLIIALLLKDEFLALIVPQPTMDKPEVNVEPMPRLPSYYLRAPGEPNQTADFEQPLRTEGPEGRVAILDRQRPPQDVANQRMATHRSASQERSLPNPLELARQQSAAPRQAEEPARLAKQSDEIARIAVRQIWAPQQRFDLQTPDRPQARELEERPQETVGTVARSAPSQGNSFTSTAPAVRLARSLDHAAEPAMQTDRPDAPQRRMMRGRVEPRPIADVPSSLPATARRSPPGPEPPVERMARQDPAPSDARPDWRSTADDLLAAVDLPPARRADLNRPRPAFGSGPSSAPTQRPTASIPQTNAIDAGRMAVSASSAQEPAARPRAEGTARTTDRASRLAGSARPAARSPTARGTVGGDGPALLGRAAIEDRAAGSIAGDARQLGPSRTIEPADMRSSGTDPGTEELVSVPEAEYGDGANAGSNTHGQPRDHDLAAVGALGRSARRGPVSRSRTDWSEPGTGGAIRESDRGTMSARLARAETASDRASPTVITQGRGELGRASEAARLPGSTLADALPGPAVPTAPERSSPSRARPLAGDPGPAVAARSTPSVPTRTMSPEGTGGLGMYASPNAGLSTPRANPRSELLHEVPGRFLRKTVGGPATPGDRPRLVADPYRRRTGRRRGEQGDEIGRPSPEIEAAIELGLAYLARVQAPDGRWSFQRAAGDTSAADERPMIVADTAATGLALLAFLGAGYDHFEDRYQAHVRQALEFLVANQKPTGDLFIPQGSSDQGVWFYSHGIATIALCEAVGMTGDADLKPAAQRAIDFLVESQHPDRGGWRYQPRAMSDLSVTGWQIMALKSGQLAGLDVPPETMAGAIRLLSRAQASATDGTRYKYNPWAPDSDATRHGREPNSVMTAVGLLMRLYTGWDRQREEIERGADLLLGRLPELARPATHPGMGNPSRDTYYWYNATQVMFHMQGEWWERWHETLYPLLIRTQVRDGPLAGSWDPRQPVPDRWGPRAGRVYVTAMNLLSMEVYYRHLPLYEEGLAGPAPLSDTH